jgi:PUA-domain protein
MKRTQLRSKEVSKRVEHLGINLTKKDQVELIDDKIILVNREPTFFYRGETILPTLKFLQTHETTLKQITVDMGAVKFLVNGADIMRPGIVDIDDGIEKDEFIVIIDENNKKPLAVGQAIIDSLEMETAKSGKVVKNIHWVGDEIWKGEF